MNLITYRTVFTSPGCNAFIPNIKNVKVIRCHCEKQFNWIESTTYSVLVVFRCLPMLQKWVANLLLSSYCWLFFRLIATSGDCATLCLFLSHFNAIRCSNCVINFECVWTCGVRLCMENIVRFDRQKKATKDEYYLCVFFKAHSNASEHGNAKSQSHGNVNRLQ